MSDLVPARRVACPNCQAPAGERCTAPTSTGRREVSWVHSAREHALSSSIETASERIAESLLDQQVRLECSACDDFMLEEIEPRRVRRLLEHCSHGHVVRADVLLVRTSVLMTKYELGLALGLPAVSDAEEKWREAQAADLT